MEDRVVMLLELHAIIPKSLNSHTTIAVCAQQQESFSENLFFCSGVRNMCVRVKCDDTRREHKGCASRRK